MCDHLYKPPPGCMKNSMKNPMKKMPKNELLMARRFVSLPLMASALLGTSILSTVITPISAHAQDAWSQTVQGSSNRPALIITNTPTPFPAGQVQAPIVSQPPQAAAPALAPTGPVSGSWANPVNIASPNPPIANTVAPAATQARPPLPAGAVTGAGGFDRLQPASRNPVAALSNRSSSIYSRPFRADEITSQDLTGNYYDPTQTLVTKKIGELGADIMTLQQQVDGLSEKLLGIEKLNQTMAAEYNASVATIATQLHTGTTPGNPRLIGRLITAQNNLERLALNVADLNSLAVEIANAASMATFLLEAARATYALSGAVEEDHVELAQIEDQAAGIIVTIDRLLKTVNDDITRMAAYLSAERNNLRTLSLAVSNGDLYGKSLYSRSFVNPGLSSFGSANAQSAGGPAADVAGGEILPSPLGEGFDVAPPALERRPLVKIRFEEPDVKFEQPVYMAVSEAVDRFPEARFEVVAVHPSDGNSARIAIESTRSRRNAERVLRTLTQMGLPLERVDLSYLPSNEVDTNEVHIFIQ